jgi:hypothetical protein
VPSGKTEVSLDHLDPLTKFSDVGIHRSCMVELALNAG